jgi:hypothetical protein
MMHNGTNDAFGVPAAASTKANQGDRKGIANVA